jgi:hypothetical protein
MKNSRWNFDDLLLLIIATSVVVASMGFMVTLCLK